jgi:hypothetical protein
MLAVGGGAAGLCAPWLYDLAREGGLLLRAFDQEPLPFWRALTLVPDVLPGLGGVFGVLAAVASGAVALTAALVAMRHRPGAVIGCLAVIVASALGATAAARWRVDVLWAPALLLPAALAIAVLGMMAARWFQTSLRTYDFGGRQLATAMAGAVVAVGLLGSVARVATSPWEGLSTTGELLPAFVGADIATVGPYRVLLLAADDDRVRWDVTRASGPSMVDYRTLRSPLLAGYLDDTVGMAAGGNPSAGAQLGLANVRYVVLVQSSERLIDALARQPALEPLPSSGGAVYRVRSWMPRTTVLGEEQGQALLATGDPGPATAGLSPFLPVRQGVYAGTAPGSGGLLFVSEATAGVWQATGDGQPLEAVEFAPFNVFRAPAGVTQVTALAAAGFRHRVLITLQVVLLLAIISLALRPPGLGRRRGGAEMAALPSQLATGAATGPPPEVAEVSPPGPQPAPETSRE